MALQEMLHVYIAGLFAYRAINVYSHKSFGTIQRITNYKVKVGWILHAKTEGFPGRMSGRFKSIKGGAIAPTCSLKEYS